MDKRLIPLLPQVVKPGRYTNHELNSQHKDWSDVAVKVALAFPDIYDIGMGNLGFKILYTLINSRKDSLAERVYAPWVDLQALLEEYQIPLTVLESGYELTCFDLIGFTLQHELSYTNILKMLDLAGISRRSSERSEADPLIMAGGPSAFNVEPLADFLDFVVLGEAEEVMHEILDVVKKAKTTKMSKAVLLRTLAKLDGIYVPALYKPSYDAAGNFAFISPLEEGISEYIEKRVICDFNALPYPEEFVVPYVEVIHDRVVAEIMRGCTRGCRFCQAGMIYRPLRERHMDVLKGQVEQLVASTGYEEVSLSSLSSADHSQIGTLVGDLMQKYQGCGISISLPSMRLDSFGMELAQEIQKARKTGLTFAPEAGTQRLRNVINKNISDQDLKNVVQNAFYAGWSRIKLYFMIGLPTETKEDLQGIVDLARKVLSWGREYRTAKRRPEVTISVASFVPKPHTPFQWMAQDSMETLRLKQNYLKERLQHPAIYFSYPKVEESFIEAVFARGDRRLGSTLERAVDLGCQFDSWTDCFRYDLWQQAFSDSGVDPIIYAGRARDFFEPLPWTHLSAGLDVEFLRKEWERAQKEISTPDCRWEDCSDCGVCSLLGVSNVVAEER